MLECNPQANSKGARKTFREGEVLILHLKAEQQSSQDFGILGSDFELKSVTDSVYLDKGNADIFILFFLVENV